MSKPNVLAIVFGTFLLLATIFESFLWRTLWFLEPVLTMIIGLACFFTWLIGLLNKDWKSVFIITFSSLIAGMILLSRTEILKSEPVLKARLIDDLSSLNLTLREDNTFEFIPVTWMGAFEKFEGKYQLQENKIIFLDEPYGKGFIPDTIDIYKDKIIMNGDLSKPDTSFANYFIIEFNSLNTQ
ncbi:hypothetical protein FNH22_25395 [Fulvivirga sp. M361]|uniref:hypothetical protein n=1 Tax=Fulvivirga sp. M361 TaxID=2594266 RepID=UPI00117B578E|nr:hypothetical protein [Fulvivirga sp. M361]TRX50659.1 hypothetical protein FNH22_25395 [Fulvivirga sp. M361]